MHPLYLRRGHFCVLEEMQYLLLLPRGFVTSAMDTAVFSDPSYSSGQVVNGGETG